MEAFNAARAASPSSETPSRVDTPRIGLPDAQSIPGRVIICTNVLPVHLHKNHGEWEASFDHVSLFEDGPMYVGLNKLDCVRQVLYVGCVPVLVPEHDRAIVESLLNEMNCFPVFPDRRLAHYHFQGYCKGVLWPIMHNVIDLYSHSDFERRERDDQDSNDGLVAEDGWMAPRSWNPMEADYCWPYHIEMANLFASIVVGIFNPEDVVWAVDYHLMLLPSVLMRKLPTSAKLGLFIHTPFPSSEIFRLCSSRIEILKAMLCADHLGFHLYEYARHFLTCCKRMLGLSYEPMKGGTLGVDFHGKTVYVSCAFGGIDPKSVSDWLSTDAVEDAAEAFVKKHSITDEIVFLGIDEVEGLRGLSLKLLAFEKALEYYPHLRNGKIKLIQIGLKLDSRPDDFDQANSEIRVLVDRINAEYGKNTVVYELTNSLHIVPRLAALATADVFVSCPVRSGFEALPMEYLLSRPDDLGGVVLLSESTGLARVFSGCLKFNVYATSKVAECIERAATMPREERIARRFRDLDYVETNTLQKWASRVLLDVVRASKKRQQEGEDLLSLMGLGFGGSMQTTKQLKKPMLNLQSFAESFKSCASSKVLFFDYSGTLAEKSAFDLYMKSGGKVKSWHYESTQEASWKRRKGGSLETRDDLSVEMRSLLKSLSEIPKTKVVVVSQDTREELAHAFEFAPKICLVAENGFVYRDSGSKVWESVVEEDNEGVWYGGSEEAPSAAASPSASSVHTAVDPADASWQSLSKRVMQSYVERTNGAFVWESEAAVQFNFTLCDPEFGTLQASNLYKELETNLSGTPTILEKGKGFCTVRRRGVNRGVALKKILEITPKVGFLATFGDDAEDELTFKYANETMTDPEVPRFNVFVGSGKCAMLARSKANCFVEDQEHLETCLESLVSNEGTSNVPMRRSLSLSHVSALQTKKTMMRASQPNLSELRDVPKAKHTRQRRSSGRQTQPKDSRPIPVTAAEDKRNESLSKPPAAARNNNVVERPRHREENEDELLRMAGSALLGGLVVIALSAAYRKVVG